MVKDKDLKMIFKLAHVKWLASGVGKVESKHYRKDIHSFVAHCAKEWPADKAVFKDPVLEPMFEAEFDAAFAQGGVGALDDMWAFLDWGFTPEDVAQHVELFVGDADDILDPEMSKRLAARLPDCAAHVWPGAGHYGVYARWEEFLGALGRRRAVARDTRLRRRVDRDRLAGVAEPVLLVDIEDRIATLTLNRPEARNALSRALGLRAVGRGAGGRRRSRRRRGRPHRRRPCVQRRRRPQGGERRGPASRRRRGPGEGPERSTTTGSTASSR